ncbi:hypothetical protein, partial [Legionella pneumophila]|uniref:hypothetical protein n=1 Tax=Legionella pneumophila TaxID=446 RepID=UPI001E4E3778
MPVEQIAGRALASALLTWSNSRRRKRRSFSGLLPTGTGHRSKLLSISAERTIAYTSGSGRYHSVDVESLPTRVTRSS